jgi:hypothetical protein
MAEYRVNLMGSDGRFESSRTFVCDTDENAIVWAREMAGERPAELWIGSQLVQHLGPTVEEAVSHEEGRLTPKDKT